MIPMRRFENGAGTYRPIIALTLTLALPSAAGDWPCWRGPARDGATSETIANTGALTAGKVAWKADVGNGYSSVAVVEDRVYTLGNEKKQDAVVCLNADTGVVIWRHAYACGDGSYEGPRATPSVDGDLVYTCSREGHVFALDRKTGAVRWSANLSALNGKAPGWGFAGSPLILGQLVILNSGQHGLALDKGTGKPVWSSPSGTGGYATPVAYGRPTPNRLLVFGQNALIVVDATDGRNMWSHPWKTSYDVNAADPIVNGDTAFISSGYGRGCALIDLGGATPRVRWEQKKMSNHTSSSVLAGTVIIGFDGNSGGGKLTAIDAATGAQRWQAGIDFGTVLRTGDNLLVLTEKGRLIFGTPEANAFKVIAESPALLDKTCWTMPVLANGRIYCRNTKGRLVCVDVR